MVWFSVSVCCWFEKNSQNVLRNYDFLALRGIFVPLIKSYSMLNLVLFGPPGAGKGTQSAFLVERYHLVHLSTGDLFRYNIKNETALGVLAKVIHGQGPISA